MLNCFVKTRAPVSIPIDMVDESTYAAWLSQQEIRVQTVLKSAAFTAKPNQFKVIHDYAGNLASVVLIAKPNELTIFSQLAAKLPAAEYRVENLSAHEMYLASVYWGLGAYQFSVYKKNPAYAAKLWLPDTLPQDKIISQVQTIYWVQDLINMPSNDLNPAALAEAASILATHFQAEIEQIIGDELLAKNYPTIHAVGRASDHAPRLIDLKWGHRNHKKLTLIGKGICFDTGGLDLKSAAGMALMKKDMAGSAHALGLARMIMQANLPIQLRLLIPAAENAVSGNAYRPGDILTTRKGLTVEITNTDAEGRLVLCDAIAEACNDKPDLLIDFATLTGAASVALGESIPAMYANDDTVAKDLMAACEVEQDLIWRMPLHQAYAKKLESKVADLVNSASDGRAGSITAALFLEKFVEPGIAWVHFDFMSWNPEANLAKAMLLRGLFEYLTKWSQN